MRERDRERERERDRDRDRETDRERPCVHPTSTLLNTYPFEHYSGGSLGAVACVEAGPRYMYSPMIVSASSVKQQGHEGRHTEKKREWAGVLQPIHFHTRPSVHGHVRQKRRKHAAGPVSQGRREAVKVVQKMSHRVDACQAHSHTSAHPLPVSRNE